MPPRLPAHDLKVVLLQPQIAPNVGNIARTCVVAGCALHMVRPLGFNLSDRQMKRAGLDYWPRLRLTVHDDHAKFLQALGRERAWLFRSAAEASALDARFASGDWLVFGSETRGIDPERFAGANGRSVALPMAEGERCLNLASAAAAGVYLAIARVSCLAEKG